MNLRLTTDLPDHAATTPTKRQVLLTLATTVVLGGAVLGIAHAQTRTSSQTGVRTDAPAPAMTLSAAPAPAPAYRTTYYLVDSQQQAGHVQAELETTKEEAESFGVPLPPSRVVVISSPEQQAAFEAGENECAAQPGCQAGTVVRIPDAP